jgi:hypothetical protein
MTIVSKIRIAALAVIVVGATYIERAEAAPVVSGSCQDYAAGYATGFCAAKGQRPSSIVYTCNADGTANIESVTCAKQIAPPAE